MMPIIKKNNKIIIDLYIIHYTEIYDRIGHILCVIQLNTVIS